MLKARLVISIVVHHWDDYSIKSCCEHLDRAISFGQKDGTIENSEINILYNGQEDLEHRNLTNKLKSWLKPTIILDSALENRGYGGTNNKVIEREIKNDIPGTILLVMNPDVYLAKEALSISITRLCTNVQFGLIAPKILDRSGIKEEWGNKRYPSLIVLAARMFPALQTLNTIKKLNQSYEYRDLTDDDKGKAVDLCSGCFMVARLDFWATVRGFDERYFMYFEDFDIAVSGTENGYIHPYSPDVVVKHDGGNTTTKSLNHKFWFIKSACKFYFKHGFKIW